MNELINNKGMTLPIILITFSIMMILGFASLFMTSTQSKLNITDDSSQKALKYAEAGYNKYLWHLNDDLNFYSKDEHYEIMNKPIEFQDGYFMLDVSKPSESDRFVTIISTGWTKDNPSTKKSILAKVRKKQFVHHVYVSDNDGPNIWWTSGDESHGPYHTNGTFRAQEGNRINNATYPIFYDTVTYYGEVGKRKIDDRISSRNKEKAYLMGEPKGEMELRFPNSNRDLKSWAEKDNMVFYGRTCIYLDGDNIKIRNQNFDDIKIYSISKDIPNLVIYVDKVPDDDKSIKGNNDKFGIRSGNIFISGKLKGRLTIGAEDTIYITYDDPTNWYDYDPMDIYNKNKKPNQPPLIFTWGGKTNNTYPESGGIEYTNTIFSGNKNGIGSNLSSYDNEKNIYMRYSFAKDDKSKPGKDMLGLIANKNVLILHYGWPKKAHNSDGRDDNWNFQWEWRNYGGIIRPDYRWGTRNITYDMGPYNITIHAAIFSVFRGYGFGYEDATVGYKKGDITLWGNITQRERKAVGTVNGTGYKKKYAHDPRMFYDYPPHILEPTNVGWEVHEWKEIKDHVIEKQ
ncbi:hypothetical protein [Tissierella praeacuta]|uniref:hypothetical protein n=1 Tax=Tissierella praeacuta TaxID=43131 RepID=UPI0033422842